MIKHPCQSRRRLSHLEQMGLTAVASGMLSLGLLLPAHMPVSRASSLTMTATVTGNEKVFADPVGDDVPLLLRAARGEKVERPPVWMMRQAGRHMQVYRDLVKEYPTFRQRSEIADVATEISLQPWRAYKTDGVILFSDILTPLPGMGIDFDILEKEGPKMPPLRTKEKIDAVLVGKDFDPEAACPFVKEVRSPRLLPLARLPPANQPAAAAASVAAFAAAAACSSPQPAARSLRRPSAEMPKRLARNGRPWATCAARWATRRRCLASLARPTPWPPTASRAAPPHPTCRSRRWGAPP